MSVYVVMRRREEKEISRQDRLLRTRTGPVLEAAARRGSGDPQIETLLSNSLPWHDGIVWRMEDPWDGADGEPGAKKHNPEAEYDYGLGLEMQCHAMPDMPDQPDDAVSMANQCQTARGPIVGTSVGGGRGHA